MNKDQFVAILHKADIEYTQHSVFSRFHGTQIQIHTNRELKKAERLIPDLVMHQAPRARGGYYHITFY